MSHDGKKTMNKKSSKAKPKRFPGVGSSRIVRRTEPSLDSLEVVVFGGQIIPILGVANSDDPEESRKTAERIRAFCSPNSGVGIEKDA